MDADEFILTLYELLELKYEMPVYQKLGMSDQQCRQWLRNLYAKRLTLRDAQATIDNVIAQKQIADEDIDEYLQYI